MGTPQIPSVDSDTKRFPNSVQNALDAYYRVAPAPTGNVITDTANLQAMLTDAQAVGGTVQLQAGTYVVSGLATSSSGKQPRILGRGMQQTFLQNSGTGSTVMLKGGSGAFSGGYLADLTFTGGGVGLEVQGACSVGWDRINFDGSQVTGILFHNKDSGEFTEYCAGEAHFGTGVKTAVEYRVTSGNESFHGSGLTGQSTINQMGSATVPSILVGAGAIAYNAPMNVTVWVRTATQPVIRINTTRTCIFHGTIRTEMFSNGGTLVDTGSASRMTLVGGVTSLGGSRWQFVMGPLDQAFRAEASSNGLAIAPLPSNEHYTPIKSGTTEVSRFDIGPTGALYNVFVIGPNYTYLYLLYAVKNPFNGGGFVQQLANPLAQNDSGWGAPTFSIVNSRLNITNANYPATGVEISVSRMQFPSEGLSQY